MYMYIYTKGIVIGNMKDNSLILIEYRYHALSKNETENEKKTDLNKLNKLNGQHGQYLLYHPILLSWL